MCRPTTPKEVARGVAAKADVEVQEGRGVVLVDGRVVVREGVLVAVLVAGPADETSTVAKASPARGGSRTIGSPNEVDARSMEGAALR